MTALVALALAFAQAAFPQGYGGPSLLSRGGNRPGQRGRATAGIVVYGGIRATAFESGLTPVQLEGDGTLRNDTYYGGQAEIGAYGSKNWRRTALGLDYRGDYRYSTRNSRYNGTNQALSLDLLHTINRRASIFFRETGGTTNRAFGAFVAAAVPDPWSLNVPNDEVFDTRSYFSQTTTGFTYRTSARFSHTIAGDWFFTKRPDPRLVGVAGYRATALTQYRLSSRTTIGGGYLRTHFGFPSAFSDAEMQGGIATLSRQVSRNVSVNATAGAVHVVSTGTQQVSLSPEVAALLGRTTGVEAFVRRFWVPQFSLSIGYTLERSRFTLAYTSGLSPGNGVYLTSQRNTVSTGYSFTGIRKLSLGLSARYSELASKAASLRNLTTIGGGGGFNYALTRLINLSGSYDYRKFTTGGIRGREGSVVMVGLTVSPARLPVSIW